MPAVDDTSEPVALLEVERPRMSGSIYHAPDLNWQELRGFPGTGDIKVLRVDVRSGAKTMLVKLPVGGRIYPHSHDRVIQHYLLDGQYESAGRVLAAGAYRLIPANTEIPLITTAQGVVFLLVSDPAQPAALLGAAL